MGNPIDTRSSFDVRGVAVRAPTSPQVFHKVIQVAMGWVDYHLWEFADDGINTAVLIVIRRLAQINPAPGLATFPDKYREIPSYDGRHLCSAAARASNRHWPAPCWQL